MANSLTYAQSGAGKTVQACRISAPNRGKNLLLCSDNSHVVLNQFPDIKKNVDIEVVKFWLDKDEKGGSQLSFSEQFDKGVESKKYDCILIDNLSDLFSMAILELDESRYGSKDARQNYKLVYDQIKRLSRKAGQLDCHVNFNAWSTQSEIVMPDGSRGIRLEPKLPPKIMDDILGLCNIIGRVVKAEKDGKMVYYYDLRGSDMMYGKDQLYGRNSCLPEDLFTVPKKEGK